MTKKVEFFQYKIKFYYEITLQLVCVGLHDFCFGWLVDRTETHKTSYSPERFHDTLSSCTACIQYTTTYNSSITREQSMSCGSYGDGSRYVYKAEDELTENHQARDKTFLTGHMPEDKTNTEL